MVGAIGRILASKEPTIAKLVYENLAVKLYIVWVNK